MKVVGVQEGKGYWQSVLIQSRNVQTNWNCRRTNPEHIS